MKQEKYDELFISQAVLISSMSYCKRAKVGAVLTKDNRIISTGWNGTPPKMDNECETIDNDKLTTKPWVIHAEMNAILFCAKHGISTNGATLYVIYSPCPDCAKNIIQAGITRVVYLFKYRLTLGIDLLKEAGIEITQFPLNDKIKQLLKLYDVKEELC